MYNLGFDIRSPADRALLYIVSSLANDESTNESTLIIPRFKPIESTFYDDSVY